MAWIILIVSGLLEAVWATALSKSDGFSKLVPSLIFYISAAASFYGLSLSLKTLPVGTAYAIWTSIGAATTVLWAMATGAEQASIVRLLLIFGIIACVIGLKMTSVQA